MRIPKTSFMEALGILQEECAEVIQAVSKIRRSGEDFKPFGGDDTNYELLVGEIQDVLTILKLLGEDDLDLTHFRKKCEKLRRWSSVFPEIPEMLDGDDF